MIIKHLMKNTKRKGILLVATSGSASIKDQLRTKLSLLFLVFVIGLMSPWPTHAQQKFYSILVNSFEMTNSSDEKLSRFIQIELSRFKKIGQVAFYRYEREAGKGRWHRIYVGKFLSKSEAKTAADELMQGGVISIYSVRALSEEKKNNLNNGGQAKDSLSGGFNPVVAKSSNSTKKSGQHIKETVKVGKEAKAPLSTKDITFASEKVMNHDSGGSRAIATNVSSDPVSETNSEISQTFEPARLSLLDAIRYSLLGNQDIQIATYPPKQAVWDLTQAESVYDPALFTSGTHTDGRTLEMTSGVDVTNVEEATSVKSGVKKLLPTGGTFSIFMQFDRLDRSNEQVDMDSRYSSAPTVELEQPLLKGIGAKAQRSAIEIANRSMNISDAEFRRTVLDVVNEVSRTYWRLFMYKELEHINQQTLELAKEVHRREVARLQDGISKQLDVERARSSVEARRTDLVRSQKRVRIATDELKLLMNWSSLTIDTNQEIIPLERPSLLPIDVIEKEAINKALENRPELNKAKENVGISEIREDLARHERLPKLDAFMRYGADGQADSFSNSFDEIGFDSDNTWAVGLEFEMPFGNRAAKARYRKQILELRQAGVKVGQLENQIKREIKQAIHAIVLAKDEIEATRLEEEAAKNVVQGEFARFELGQMTNEELLRAQDHLANAQRNNAQAIISYNIALANLARAEGILTPGLSFADIN